MTIYCFDIDGTICTQTNRGGYANAKPFLDMRDRINRLYDLGHWIIFMTARGSVSGIDYEDLTKQQLEEWGFRYNELIIDKKPHADVFVDDKAQHVSQWRTHGKRVGFVASCWDLIHPGYIKLFKEAKLVCEHLICGLQVDPSLERPEKNPPVQTVEERRIVLESIRYVDEVVTYHTEKDLEDLLCKIDPDIRFLGTDYENKEYTGDYMCIPIYWHARDHAWSTTALKDRIVKMHRDKKHDK